METKTRIAWDHIKTIVTFHGYGCRMERNWLNSERMETVEKRSETVALAVFSTTGGVKELKNT